MIWKGVMPAITTCFDEALQIDHGFLAEHCRWLLDNGCSGVVVLGSCEKAQLSRSRKESQSCGQRLKPCTGAGR